MIEPIGPSNAGVVLIGIEQSDKPMIPRKYHIAEGRTSSTATLFDTYSKTYSENSIYRDVVGDYIKKNSKKYYIGDFK